MPKFVTALYKSFAIELEPWPLGHAPRPTVIVY